MLNPVSTLIRVPAFEGTTATFIGTFHDLFEQTAGIVAADLTQCPDRHFHDFAVLFQHNIR